MRRTIAALGLLAGITLALASAVPAAADPGNGNSFGNEGQPPGQAAASPHSTPPDNSNAGGNGGGQGQSTAPSSVPGFNGDIKIHSGSGEPAPIEQNEPHPGTSFHVHGFNFDANASGTWRIVAWPPTGDHETVVASGTWTADANGDWRTAAMSGCDLGVGSGLTGHFKVFADQTSPAAPGDEKHKVFWVECAGAPTPTPTTEVSAGASASPSPTQLGVQQPPTTVGASPTVETSAPQASAPQASAPPTAVAGVVQPPGGQHSAGAQSGAAPGASAAAQAQGNVQPQIAAGLATLPSTSTGSIPPALASGLVLIVFGIDLLRRRR